MQRFQDNITSYIPLYYILNLGYKVYNRIHKDTFALIHIGHAHEVFRDEVIFFTWDVSQVTR